MYLPIAQNVKTVDSAITEREIEQWTERDGQKYWLKTQQVLFNSSEFPVKRDFKEEKIANI